MRVRAGDGAEVAVRVDGRPDGRPVLLLHSIGCDHRMWDAQVEPLADFRLIRADLRGHGASDAPAGDYALARLAADMADVLAALDARDALVCGLSLGGLVAQQMALAAPERIAGLALANTAARIGTAEAWTDRAAVVRADGLAAIADMAMARFFSDAFRADEATTVGAFRARLVASSADGYAGCCAALRDADLRGETGRIAVPTLVIGGTLDVSTPPAAMRELAAALPNGRYAELPAAHLSNVEQPAAFARLLLDHLEAL